MRRQLKEWLELSMNHNVPSSLLIMSRAFLLTADSAVQEGLQQAIGSLPDEVVETVLADTETDERKRREQRLEMLERQNELIEEEGLARETTSSPSIPESSAPSASVASHTTPSSGPSVDGVSSSPETNAETEGVQKEFDEDRVTTDSLIREIRFLYHCSPPDFPRFALSFLPLFSLSCRGTSLTQSHFSEWYVW